MKTREFVREDLHSILATQDRCPQASRWLEADYLRLVDNPGGTILVAELDALMPPKVVGFAAFHRIMDEAELSNLAVDPDYQRRGAGKALLVEACKRLAAAGAKRIYLEVRPSNRAALGLYYSRGFSLHSMRKDYYRDPSEDAYVLRLDLWPASG